MALPQNTYTIEDMIEAGRNTTISYSNLSFSDVLSNGTRISVQNVVRDYLDELIEASVLVKMTDSQQRTYFYKPKLLCHDVYGNPEVFFIILMLNDMADVKEFNNPILRMLKKKDMDTLISQIYNEEKENIEEYSK